MEIAGYIVMMAPKKKGGSEYFAPMAYGMGNEKGFDDVLLRDRGATIFPSQQAASDALRETLTTAQSAGHEWPEKYSYAVVVVRHTPSNAQVTGSPVLSASPRGLPGSAAGGKGGAK